MKIKAVLKKKKKRNKINKILRFDRTLALFIVIELSEDVFHAIFAVADQRTNQNSKIEIIVICKTLKTVMEPHFKPENMKMQMRKKLNRSGRGVKLISQSNGQHVVSI